jgi:hypothetical protein
VSRNTTCVLCCMVQTASLLCHTVRSEALSQCRTHHQLQYNPQFRRHWCILASALHSALLMASSRAAQLQCILSCT